MKAVLPLNRTSATEAPTTNANSGSGKQIMEVSHDNLMFGSSGGPGSQFSNKD